MAQTKEHTVIPDPASVIPDPAVVIPDPAVVIPNPAVVIPNPAVVIPDLIRDPVLRDHWIADRVRNDNRARNAASVLVGRRDEFRRHQWP
jgi:hypothetical protein